MGNTETLIIDQQLPMQRSFDYDLKFILIGSSSVGKTSVLKRFADDTFEENYISTIGIDFRFKSLYIDEFFVKIQLWDTAGQERFRGVTKSYYKGSHAVILVCDATNPKSFDDVFSHWFKESRQYQQPARIFCFINKCDDGEDTVLPQQQYTRLKGQDITIYKVSAKKSFEIKESILQIANLIMPQQKRKVKQSSIYLPEQKMQFTRKKNSKCCSN